MDMDSSLQWRQTVDSRLDGVETRLDGVKGRLDGVERRLDGVETRLHSLDCNMSEVKSDIRELRQELKSNFKWVIGVVITSVLATAAIVVAFGQWQAGWFQNSINANQAANRAQLEEMDKRWLMINAEQQKRVELMFNTLEKRADRRN